MNKLKCKCGKIATWYYMPSDNEWVCCEDCVPRGCSCMDSNDIDEEGRKLPCCEWWYDKEGWDNE